MNTCSAYRVCLAVYALMGTRYPPKHANGENVRLSSITHYWSEYFVCHEYVRPCFYITLLDGMFLCLRYVEFCPLTGTEDLLYTLCICVMHISYIRAHASVLCPTNKSARVCMYVCEREEREKEREKEREWERASVHCERWPEQPSGIVSHHPWRLKCACTNVFYVGASYVWYSNNIPANV